MRQLYVLVGAISLACIQCTHQVILMSTLLHENSLSMHIPNHCVMSVCSCMHSMHTMTHCSKSPCNHLTFDNTHVARLLINVGRHMTRDLKYCLETHMEKAQASQLAFEAVTNLYRNQTWTKTAAMKGTQTPVYYRHVAATQTA